MVIDQEVNREEEKSPVVPRNGDRIQPAQDVQIQPRSQFEQKSQVNIVTQDQGDGTVKTQSQMVIVQTQVTDAAHKTRKRKNDTEIDGERTQIHRRRTFEIHSAHSPSNLT